MTQRAAIISCLKRGWKSPLDALKEAGTMKLSTRVGELKLDGWEIISKWHDSRKYKMYKIVSSPKKAST